MPAKYRKKPLAQFEHGTRIYAPSTSETRYRVVATDPETGRRFSTKAPDEDAARRRAHEIEERIARSSPVHAITDERSRTVRLLAHRYVEDHLATLSLRFREKQQYLLDTWILPRIGDLPLARWTPAESMAVLTAVRNAGRSPALIQDVGAAMRALVTHGRRLRWFGPQSDDPMWMVTYSKRATIQGASVDFVARSSLPTDDQCDDLFRAMARLGEPMWALAMKLKHRSGLRWGELTALRAEDVAFDPADRAGEPLGRARPPQRSRSQGPEEPPRSHLHLPQEHRRRSPAPRRGGDRLQRPSRSAVPRPPGRDHAALDLPADLDQGR